MSGLELAVFVLGWGSAAWWIYSGFLSPRAFLHSPQRRVGLNAADLLVGLFCCALGPMMAVRLLAIWYPGVAAEKVDTPSEVALRMLAWQLGQAPLLVYLVVRLSRMPRGLHRFGLLCRRPAFDFNVSAVALLTILPFVFAVMSVSAWLSAWLFEPPPRIAHDMLVMMRQTREPWVLVVMAGSAVILAPIMEEVLFRGLLQTVILRIVGPRRHWPGILIASCWFTLMHVPAVEWQALPALMVLAVCLGWLYERTGSLWPSIFVHMAFNALNIALAWTIA